ncbi:Crp/Fnr family transcriptional regulator [Rhodobacteraceae bacterium F11138]|nr:Crp/Fnr family transcriptional regulator [Rhodobacteraceae bacterium F11138]
MQLKDARQIANRVGWLARQPKTFRKLVLDATELQMRTPGENVYGLGDPPGGLHCLVDGYLDVFTTAGAFNPFLGFIARPGWWAGDVAAITRSERRAEVRARTEVVLLFVPGHKIEQIARQDPVLWRRLGELNAEHLDNALLFAVTALQRDVRTRLLATLIRLASFEATFDAEIEIDCTQADLAEMAGLTRNTIGGALKELQAEGLVSRRYGRIAYNPVCLRAVLPTVPEIETYGSGGR